jgi:hypothetical protein
VARGIPQKLVAIAPPIAYGTASSSNAYAKRRMTSANAGRSRGCIVTGFFLSRPGGTPEIFPPRCWARVEEQSRIPSAKPFLDRQACQDGLHGAIQLDEYRCAFFRRHTNNVFGVGCSRVTITALRIWQRHRDLSLEERSKRRTERRIGRQMLPGQALRRRLATFATLRQHQPRQSGQGLLPVPIFRFRSYGW